MADNYLSLSFGVPLKNEEERQWCANMLDALEDNEVDPKPKEVEDVFDEDFDYLDFEYRVNEDYLWIYGEISANPDMIGRFLQAFLKKFHPDAAIWFSWAYSCSKPRLNEFGGGTMVVTAKAITAKDSGEWAFDQMNRRGLTSVRPEMNLFTKGGKK